jgi:hypothetical protein
MVVMHVGYSEVRMSDRHWPTAACSAVCEVMFGPDYASLMSKAAEVARPAERKAAETAKPAKQPRAG